MCSKGKKNKMRRISCKVSFNSIPVNLLIPVLFTFKRHQVQYVKYCKNTPTSKLTLKSTALARHAKLIKPHLT